MLISYFCLVICFYSFVFMLLRFSLTIYINMLQRFCSIWLLENRLLFYICKGTTQRKAYQVSYGQYCGQYLGSFQIAHKQGIAGTQNSFSKAEIACLLCQNVCIAFGKYGRCATIRILLRFKSMVFVVQKGGFQRAKRGFLCCKNPLFVF